MRRNRLAAALGRLAALAGLVLLVALGDPAGAASRAAAEHAFQTWLAQDLRPRAAAAGISQATLDRAFRGVALDWSLPELVPPGTTPEHRTESQAEFRSPAAYFDQGNLNAQVEIGRRLLREWADTLAAIERRMGVPGEIVVAIWARESSFGRASIPHAAIRTLATHAFMGRRKELFDRELVAALAILETGEIEPDRMRSSWAGALGQPQFLPSHYLRYAVDFDGDGRRDIWTSVPDTLASIANLLREKGWDPERGWGIEAAVPPGVSCTLEGPDQGMGMAEWGALGVTQVDGRPLPRIEQNRPAHLMMPAGRLGPAFIVSRNFYVIKEYNYSDLYALYVGHLADRFADNRPFVAEWQGVGAAFTRADVARMQRAMEAAGHDVGGADGLVGFKTRVATGRWQALNRLPETCMPDAAMVRGIR